MTNKQVAVRNLTEAPTFSIAAKLVFSENVTMTPAGLMLCINKDP